MPPAVLITCEGLKKAYGSAPLFSDLGFSLFEGDRVGLVGPNGAGKSTLLRIVAGLEEPDEGRRAVRKHLRVGYVPQDPIFAPGTTVEELVLERLAESTRLAEHERFHRAAIALGKVGFADRGAATETLSGGWRKRLAIARELALEPEVLLLDEPTNHLDLEAILWLESFLASEPTAFVAVSHDRYFLENVARRMLELDRVLPGGLLAVDGRYSDLLERRDEVLQHQAAYQANLANRARREIEWLRRGPKARTTKAKARVDSAERLVDELADSQARTRRGTAGVDFQASERQTRRLWHGKGISKQYGERVVLRPFDLLLGPRMRLGVLGANGSGKTTLLRLVTGDLAPSSGTIDRAPELRTVYFEQNRESLDPAATLARALSPTGDSVVYQGRELHVAAWASRFLFRPEQLRTPVSALSGGEKARIVLARLMLRPADLLVLDEPTNDLDIPTLEVLEESLLEFPGALVLVTHDRYLLDRVATRLLALDGAGGVEAYADYRQWEADQRAAASPGASPPAAAPDSSPRPPRRPQRKRLSYKEQREWEGMEAAILAAEERVEAARLATEDPAVATDAGALQERYAALAAAQAEVERLMARWAELESQQG